MSTIRESDLPGIGRKFQIEARNQDRIVIIVHDDGMREIYLFRHDNPDECVSVITLSDTEARQVAGIIGGMAYKPKELEAVELALDELVVEWYRLTPESPAKGRSIGELNIRQQVGASIAAVVGVNGAKKINPGPEQILNAGDTLVILGERSQIRAFRRLMMDGG